MDQLERKMDQLVRKKEKERKIKIERKKDGLVRKKERWIS